MPSGKNMTWTSVEQIYDMYGVTEPEWLKNSTIFIILS